ncbi:MAG: sulfatase-like hydrolase/transferase [Halobacteria archaeon]|nr:sulfatase-like hydrolase/transferase [Halobacteria archaeon]
MNVVFVSVDCIRPDFFDHRFYERLKASGSYYDTCITQAAFTSPSHTSMLSGLNPFNHGVRWLIDYETDATLLPEVLSEEGYNTVGFTGGYPLPTGNIPDSFDEFHHITPMEDRMEGRGDEFGPANLLVNRAVNWLDDHEGEDNFVFIHSFDLHLTLRSEFGKRDEPEFDENNVYENVEQYIGRYQRRYREESEFVARQLENLHELVDIDATVVTGDHGSKMPGEHGYPWVYDSEGNRVGSQFRAVELYDNLIRVPLVFSGDPFPDKTVHEQVRSIDIVPTLLDALEIDAPEMDGETLLDGEHPEFAYSETYHGQLTKENKLTHKMNERYDFGWNELDSLVCLRSNEWKLICTANGELEPVELYYIAQDPGEERNLLDNEGEVAEEYFDDLQDILEGDEQMYVTAAEVNQTTKNRLEDLGYL